MPPFEVGHHVIFRSGFTPATVAAIAPNGTLFLLDSHGPIKAQPDQVMLVDEFIAQMKAKQKGGVEMGPKPRPTPPVPSGGPKPGSQPGHPH